MSRNILSRIVKEALKAADPVRAVREALRDDRVMKELSGARRVYVVGMGKASERMLVPVVEILEEKIVDGCVAVPRGTEGVGRVGPVRLCPAGHPVPDEGSLRAGSEILRLAGEAGEGDVVLALVSGGGSALAEKPLGDVKLEELRRVNKLLLQSGASIHEINTVRKHLSLVKGGRLAVTAWPASVLGFIVSDVPGDRLDMIASGPTVADPTSFADAIRVLERYDLLEMIPGSIRETLERGVQGLVEETPKPGDPRLSKTLNMLVLRNIDVLEHVAGFLRGQGFETLILTSRLEGESREAARVLASIGLEIAGNGLPLKPPAAVIAGGETTVTVRNPGGRGGRNTELALAWALSVRYWGGSDLWLVAFDTDGIDGNSNAAGGFAWPGLVDQLREKGFDPWKFLDENRSYDALEKVGGLIVTGPTGTNVNSIVVMLVGSGRR